MAAEDQGALLALLEQGQEHFAARRFKEADQAFNRALDLDGRNIVALLGRAFCLRKQREYDEAQRVLNRALFHYPNNLPIITEQAHLYHAQKNFGKALQTYERALGVDPGNVQALAGKIKCLRLLQRWDEGEKVAAAAPEALTTNPEVLTERGWLYLGKGRYDEAVEAFVEADDEGALREALKSNPPRETDLLMEAILLRLPRYPGLLNACGDLYSQHGQYEKAMAAYDRTLQVDQANQGAWGGKIKALGKLGRFAEGEKALASMPETLRLTPGVLIGRAWLHLEQDRYADAVDDFLAAHGLEELENAILGTNLPTPEHLAEAALKRLPHHAGILNKLAGKLRDLKLYDKAIAVLDRTLAANPDDLTALRMKADCFKLQGEFDKAAEVLSKALASQPKERGLRTDLALIRCHQKRYDEAAKAFIEAHAADLLVSEGNRLQVHGRPDDAGKLLDAGLRHITGNVKILNQRGWLHYDLKQYEQAAQTFDQSLKVDPNDEYALRMRSMSLRLLRRFPEAGAAIQEAIDRLPNNVPILIESAWLLFDQTQYTQAVKVFDQALDLRPEDVDAREWKIRALRALRKPEEMEKAITEALQWLPRNARIMYLRGLLHYDRDEYEKAEEWFAKAVEVDPSYLEAHFDRADTLTRLDRSYQALEVLQQLRAARPDDKEVWGRLGWFYLGQNDWIRARQEFEAIFKADPTNVTGINSMGALYFNQGSYEEAEEYFRKALGFEPNNVALHVNLSWALVRQTAELPPAVVANEMPTWRAMIGEALAWRSRNEPSAAEERLREAEEHCRKALELDPNFGKAYGCLGVIAFKRRRPMESEDFLKSSIRLSPKEGNYADLGALYVQMGRYDEAEKILVNACQIDKTDAQVRLELGNLYLQTDRAKQAIRMFREGMAANPNSEDPPRALAIALMRGGEFTDAARLLRKAICQHDESRRWQLHLTLCQLLTEMGDKNEEADLYEEAYKEVATAIHLKPRDPAPYFYAGIVRFKQQDYRSALRHFGKCLDLDPLHFDAEQNSRRVRALLSSGLIQGGLYGGILLGAICVVMLATIWNLYFFTSKITTGIIETLTPVLLGLLVVSFLLPWLSRLKLLGMEAELTRPAEKISKGLTGTVSFGASSLSSGPR